MKRFITLVVLLIAFNSSVLAENEYDTAELLETPQQNEVRLMQQDFTDVVNEELKVFDIMGKDTNSEVTELTPLQRVLKTEITRTDVPSYLFKEELTFDYKKGPVSETQFYAAYRGSLNGLFSPHNYSTTYENNATEFGVLGKFRDPDYNFKFMIRPIPVDGLSYMDGFFGDIYLVNKKIPHHEIITGYQRTQIGMEGGMGQYTLPFYSRSQIARNFGNTRSISAKIVGNYNYADYSVSVGSSGHYITNGMPGAEFVSWLNIKPFGSTDGKLGKLTVGGGLNTGHHGIDYTVGSAYIGYKHKKLWTNFEASVADGYSGSKGTSANKAGGFAFTAGWKLTPHIQIIGRIDQFDPNRHKHNDIKREYSAGINWFIKGQALRLILNYVYCQNQNAHDSHKLIIGTQIMI